VKNGGRARVRVELFDAVAYGTGRTSGMVHESLDARPCVDRVLAGKLELQFIRRDLHDTRFDLFVLVPRDQLVSFNAPLACERDHAGHRCEAGMIWLVCDTVCSAYHGNIPRADKLRFGRALTPGQTEYRY